MGNSIEFSGLSDDSFKVDFRQMIESGNFTLNERQKDFLRHFFPNRTFKNGCKSCWSDAVIEFINSLIRTDEQPKLEVAEGGLFLIDEAKYGYPYMGVKINGEFVFISKNVEETQKNVKGKKVISENSVEAQAFFLCNPLLHKYLMKG